MRLWFFLRDDKHTSRALTVDEVLLLWRDDADQVAAEVPAALLGVQPHLPVGEVQVAVPLELGPAVFTPLLICSGKHQRVNGQPALIAPSRLNC